MSPMLRQLTQLVLSALFVLLGADAQPPAKTPSLLATPEFTLEPRSFDGLLQGSDSTDFQLESDADFDTTDQGDVVLEALGERWQSWTLSSTLVGVERPPAPHSGPSSCHTPRAPPRFRSLV